MRPTHRLTIVGLGTGSPPTLSPDARRALRSGLLFLRSSSHPSVTLLEDLRWVAFDGLFDGTDPFADVADAIAHEVLAAALDQPVVYAVPGNPLSDDGTVCRVRAWAAEAGVTLDVIPARSLIEPALAAVAPSAGQVGLQIIDALDVAGLADSKPFAGGFLPLNPLQPAVITGLETPALAAAVARTLRRFYPAEAAVHVIGAPNGLALPHHRWTLEVLGTRPLPPAAVAYMAPVEALDAGRTSDALQQIVARLRAPEGCPWDREQTHASLRQAAIEEAYEVIEAIDRGNAADLREELGDLLLQAYLHAQIAEEAGEFTLEDVFDSIRAKLVRRHPHVFGDVAADTAAAVVTNWDHIKRQERAERGVEEAEHPLGSIPTAMPALMRAQTVVRRARRAGLVIASNPDVAGATPEALADALLGLAASADDAGLDAEELLRARSRRVEEQAGQLITRQQGAGRTPAEGETAR